MEGGGLDTDLLKNLGSTMQDMMLSGSAFDIPSQVDYHGDQQHQSHEMKTKRTQRINETKSWLFEKMNEINIPLVKLTKEKEDVN
jgi:hypothetical protein